MDISFAMDQEMFKSFTWIAEIIKIFSKGHRLPYSRDLKNSWMDLSITISGSFPRSLSFSIWFRWSSVRQRISLFSPVHNLFTSFIAEGEGLTLMSIIPNLPSLFLPKYLEGMTIWFPPIGEGVIFAFHYYRWWIKFISDIIPKPINGIRNIED